MLAKHESYPLPYSWKGETLTSIKCLLGKARLWQEELLGWVEVRRREGEALASRCVQQLGLLPGPRAILVSLREEEGPEGRSIHFAAGWPLEPLKKWRLAFFSSEIITMYTPHGSKLYPVLRCRK